MNTIHRGDYFSVGELEYIVKSCPNGKSCGVDGVFYEDLKKMFPDYGHVLTNILNIMLINQRISTSWKHGVIQLSQKRILLRKICQRYVISPYYRPDTRFYQKLFVKELFRIFQTLYRFCTELFSENGTGKNSYSH